MDKKDLAESYFEIRQSAQRAAEERHDKARAEHERAEAVRQLFTREATAFDRVQSLLVSQGIFSEESKDTNNWLEVSTRIYTVSNMIPLGLIQRQEDGVEPAYGFAQVSKKEIQSNPGRINRLMGFLPRPLTTVSFGVSLWVAETADPVAPVIIRRTEIIIDGRQARPDQEDQQFINSYGYGLSDTLNPEADKDSLARDLEKIADVESTLEMIREAIANNQPAGGIN